MAKFQMVELIGTKTVTARLGAGTGAANLLNDKDVNKLVKLVADSRYDLCVAGDAIEGFIQSVDTATTDGYSTGGVVQESGQRKTVTFDGVQATPGTGAIAVGDYVVAGTITAKGTAVQNPKVCKATSQTPGAFAWRVVSILSGTGAVGSVGVIERV